MKTCSAQTSETEFLIDHLFILVQAGGVQLPPPRFGLSQVFFSQQSTAKGSVGQQLDLMRLAKRNHRHLRMTINQWKLHLIGDDADTRVRDARKVFGIKVCQP